MRVLDLSRSFSRIDRPVATGIDRVERAYWAEFSRRGGDVWAVIRVGQRFALLDQNATDRLIGSICSGDMTARSHGFITKMSPRYLAKQYAALSLRKRSVFFGPLSGLMSQLAVRMPHGFDYFNVGHSNLEDRFLGALKAVPAAKVHVKLHDTIPLDFPQFVRRKSIGVFRNRFHAALKHADRIICNSASTAGRIDHYSRELGLSQRPVIAHLGIDVPEICPASRKLPGDQAPYFLCVGTIEPRKNHALLFEVWEQLISRAAGRPVPRLVLVGGRGWNNKAVFDYLDRSPLVGPYIQEQGQVNDTAMFGLLANASGLLFPSFAEGFGLPALEAKALGTPVLCSDIDVFKELLGNGATFLPTANVSSWVTSIEKILENGTSTDLPARQKVPDWKTHFETVLGPDLGREIRARP